MGNKENTFKWSVDNNKIYVDPPTNIHLWFRPRVAADYLILTYAARTSDSGYEANYQLNGEKGTWDMKNRPRWKYDPPLPKLAHLTRTTEFIFSGSKLVFQSISVMKF